MKTILRRFKNNESGATAIEYGLIAAFIALAIVVALGQIKPHLSSVFTSIDTNLASATTPAGTPTGNETQ